MNDKIKKLIQAENFDQALALIEEELGKNKEDSRQWVLKGNIMARQERTQEALDSYDQAIDVDPGNLDAYNGRALVYFILDDKKKGFLEVEKAWAVSAFRQRKQKPSRDELRQFLTAWEDGLVNPELGSEQSVPSSFCVNCGTKLSSSDTFCTKCGTKKV